MDENAALEVLEEAVRQGYAVKDDQSRFTITPSGERVVVRNALLDVFNHRHDAALTFGALVAVAGLKSQSIIEPLSDLISDGVVQMGIYQGPVQVRIFHLCKHQKTYHLFGGPGENLDSPALPARSDRDVEEGSRKDRMKEKRIDH